MSQFESHPMTFDVEIVLRERDYAITEQIPSPGASICSVTA